MGGLRRLRAAVTAVASGVVLAGCGPTMADLPLPGTGVSGDTVSIRVDFDEALNLSEGATVKVNGVDSGRVQQVTAQDFRAQATMLVREDAGVREGARARLRYTTPLGELYVDVTNPESGAALREGAVIDTSASGTAPTVEDALASASLLINGGGLAQLQTVADELNTALGGREDTVRRVLQRSEVFLTEANATTADIDRALRALASVSAELRRRETTIDQALRDIRPAARVLRRNTSGLTELLASVEEFSGTANQTVRATRRQLLTLINEVEPVLAEFTANRTTFGPSLDQLVLAGTTLDTVVPGDYLNMYLELHLDRLTVPGTDIEVPQLPQLPGVPLPEPPQLPDLGLGLPGLPLPGLPDILGLGSSTTGSNGLTGLLGGSS
ncbi:MCE family protein [Nocardioides sp.]|uniref:MCE family protein n=1 Tax=Nocardioides sp. TaxID=35761 RepID=UPI0027373B8B|nr:MCE family protein [Nocardioides sp.]MDP3892727.1 MCE family protein [Nocardioides sp.]